MTGTELIEYENKSVAKLRGSALEKYIEEQKQLMIQLNNKLVSHGRKAAFYDLDTAVLTTMIVKNDNGTMQIVKRDRPIRRNVFGTPSVGATVTSNIINKREGKYNDADMILIGEASNIEFKEVGSFLGRD